MEEYMFFILAILGFIANYFQKQRQKKKQEEARRRAGGQESVNLPPDPPKAQTEIQDLLDELLSGTRPQQTPPTPAPPPLPATSSKSRSRRATPKPFLTAEQELHPDKPKSKRKIQEAAPEVEEENSFWDEFGEDFDMRKAIIYSEILKRPDF